MHYLTATSVAVAALASTALAHGPPAGLGSHTGFKRATATQTPTEQSEAKISNSTEECTYYYLPEVNSLLPNYPKVRRNVAVCASQTVQ